MNYAQQLTQTLEVEEDSRNLYAMPPGTGYVSDSESAYAILLVGEDGQTRLLYAPKFLDVSSGHTAGQHTAICANLPKGRWSFDETNEGYFGWESSTRKDDRSESLVDLFASRVTWFPLTPKRDFVELPPLKKLGRITGKILPLRKTKLLPGLNR